MFLHNFKYELLCNIRQKDFIFWMMCFPIILGTLFYLGFGKVYQNEAIFSEIPVAVVEQVEDPTFTSVMNEMESAEKKLFEFKRTDMADAEELLKNGDVAGIITVDNKLTLTLYGSGIKHTILKSFLDQYLSQKNLITGIASTSPEKLPEVVQKLSEEIEPIKKESLSGGNMNPYDSYFQNLITMAALFGCMTGVFCATRNQGNLSAIGARKNISPRHGFGAQLSSFLAAYVTQLLSACVAATFVLFVLRIDLGNNIPMIYVSGAIGAFAGVAIGFLIGSIGRAGEEVKSGIATAVCMFSCFLSGLMIGGIKSTIEDSAPIINRINPATLTSDLFYCLTIYDDYTRYIKSAASLLIISVLCIAGGLVLTRRKTYENL